MTDKWSKLVDVRQRIAQAKQVLFLFLNEQVGVCTPCRWSIVVQGPYALHKISKLCRIVHRGILGLGILKQWSHFEQVWSRSKEQKQIRGLYWNRGLKWNYWTSKYWESEIKLRSSLIPRSDKTSCFNDPSSLDIKYRADVNKIKTHKTCFFSPPLTPRIEASQTGVLLRPKIVSTF